MVTYKINDNGVIRDATAEERVEIDSLQKPIDFSARKLAEIRKIRNQKLSETDYFAMSDNTMSDEMKAFRKSMRDIPQDYSADKYDELLARETDKTEANFGQLTHTVWEKQ